MKKAQFIENMVNKQKEKGLTAFETAEAISKFMAQSFVTEEEYEDGKISLDDIIPFIPNVVAYTDYVVELNLDSDWKNIVDTVKNAWTEDISRKSKNVEKIKELLSGYKTDYPKRAKIANMYETEDEGEFRKYIDWVDLGAEWQNLYNNFNKATRFSDKVNILVNSTEKFINDEVKLEPKLKELIETQFQEMLKDFEKEITSNPGVCSYLNAKKLFNSKLFSETQFIAKNWMTPDSWKAVSINFGNSRVNISIDNVDEYKFDEKDIKDWDKYQGATDVFFFGIPRTGKTCLLMGLVGLNGKEITLSDKRKVRFSFNSREGGLYFLKLHTFLKAHCTPGSTNEDFMAVVRAQITCGNETHKINLIELAGENFQKKVVKIEADKVDIDKEKDEVDKKKTTNVVPNYSSQNTSGNKSPELDDFGPGLTEYLKKTKNPKIFFCVLDPTQEMIKTKISPHAVSQGLFIQYFIDILDDIKQNGKSEWLDLINAIYIVLTKSDSIEMYKTNPKGFDAKTFVNNKFPETSAVSTYCGIDLDTGILPFSLADQFFVGDYYNYNPETSKEIIKTIFDYTDGVREKTRIDHILEWFDTPLFS